MVIHIVLGLLCSSAILNAQVQLKEVTLSKPRNSRRYDLQNLPRAHKIGEIRSSEIRRKPENTKINLQGTPVAKALKTNNETVNGPSTKLKPLSQVRQAASTTYTGKSPVPFSQPNNLSAKLKNLLAPALSVNAPSKIPPPYIQPSPIAYNLPPGVPHIAVPGTKRIDVELPVKSQSLSSGSVKMSEKSSNPTIVVYIPPPIIAAPLIATAAPASETMSAKVQTLSAGRYGVETVTLPSVTLPTINLPSINLPTFPPLTMPPSFNKILSAHTTEAPVVYRPISEQISEESGDNEQQLLFTQKKRKPRRKQDHRKAQKNMSNFHRQKMPIIQDENIFVDSDESQPYQVQPQLPSAFRNNDELTNTENGGLPKYVNEDSDNSKFLDDDKSWTVAYRNML